MSSGTQYIAIITDNSGSMRHLASKARDDYNATVDEIKSEAAKTGINTSVSVIKCGVGWKGEVVRHITNRSAHLLKPMAADEYDADGHSTPLYDSVGTAIELLQRMPDANDRETSFLVMVTTDGLNNVKIKWDADSIGAKMQELMATDRWTFTFRTPKAGKSVLERAGVPEYNIHCWEQTQKGLEKAQEAQTTGLRAYYKARSEGAGAVRSFYVADLKGVSSRQVAAKLTEITAETALYPITDGAKNIRDFVTEQTGSYATGRAFYELDKPETVQNTKLICLLHKMTDKVYAGTDVRDMLGIPGEGAGNIKLRPGMHGEYEIYVQSTSVNRRLIPGKRVLVWDNPRKL